VIFAWISDHRAEFQIQAMCAALEVSASGFYAWLKRPLSRRKLRSQALSEAISEVHRDSDCIYGSPRVHQELLARGVQVCENTVARWMRLQHIRSKIVRKFVPCTTDSNHALPVANNRLNRDFEASGPNQKWVADITYVETQEGWLFLAGVMDLYSRKIVGWSMSDNMRVDLVADALKMALVRRRPEPGFMHHSDQGVQYASADYQNLLTENGCICSMSRTANCYDNAVMESFWGSLKTELVYHRKYSTRDEARQSLFRYIEVFYNRIRRHSSLGYVSPEAFEAARN